MKKWKKFIAMGLAVSMIVPSCIPQTLWASEFSAGSVESAADVFEDGAGYETGSESGNKMSDENNSGDEFGTGELKDQEPEQSETEDSVNAGQSAEGYNILLYSDGKLEKTYVIPYADVDTAKVPEALKGKTGYIFKEWNTKEDGTGETYKPGDSIKKLLETADMAKQAQETSERTEAGEEIKPEKDVMQEENDVAQTDSASWEEKTDKAEMQISDTENDGTSPDRQTMEAMFAYLGEKFGKNNCYISNWILGNEVNSASGYYYVGNVSFSKFISMYSEAFRCLYNAVKSSRGSSKVFICLDNCWNQKNAFTICYSARSTLESFAAKISDMQKDVNWNLAYHAYNQPLSDSQFWSGANASMFTSDANTTTFITMRNIQTLTDYVKNRFGSNTRIILSEQGFSSTYGGQTNQAAAIALAYYKAACNPMIDAFIIRSYKDEAHEVAQGLAMGLKDANGKKKTAYNVFKNMDSSNSLKYTEKVLKSQVGNWKSLVPGYSTGKISSMYRK